MDALTATLRLTEDDICVLLDALLEVRDLDIFEDAAETTDSLVTRLDAERARLQADRTTPRSTR